MIQIVKCKFGEILSSRSNHNIWKDYGYIYVFNTIKEENLIKIGKSINVYARLVSLNRYLKKENNSIKDVIIYGIFDNVTEMENLAIKTLSKQFKQINGREWFSGDLLQTQLILDKLDFQPSQKLKIKSEIKPQNFQYNKTSLNTDILSHLVLRK